MSHLMKLRQTEGQKERERKYFGIITRANLSSSNVSGSIQFLLFNK